MKSKRRNLLNYKSRGAGKTKHKHLSKHKRSKRKHRNKKTTKRRYIKRRYSNKQRHTRRGGGGMMSRAMGAMGAVRNAARNAAGYPTDPYLGPYPFKPEHNWDTMETTTDWRTAAEKQAQEDWEFNQNHPKGSNDGVLDDPPFSNPNNGRNIDVGLDGNRKKGPRRDNWGNWLHGEKSDIMQHPIYMNAESATRQLGTKYHL